MTNLVLDSAERLFSGFNGTKPDAAKAPSLSPDLWQAVTDAGFPFALLAEDDGGFGLDPAEALGILRIAGRYCAVAPVGETMVANWLLARAGLPLSDGPAAVQAMGSDGNPVGSVPWGRYLSTLVLYEDRGGTIEIRRIPVDSGTVQAEGRNLADEPRDRLSFPSGIKCETAGAALSAATPSALNALVRVMLMAGALDAVLDRTVTYATERVQFGRPIAKFQAIQQSLAVVAGEVAAAGAAATMAAQAFSLAGTDPATFTLLVAAAKVRAGEAAGMAADLSHQVHGAIGFSRDYALHPLTRRLWSWRDEDGTETQWAETLGATIAPSSGTHNGLWDVITRLQAGAF